MVDSSAQGQLKFEIHNNKKPIELLDLTSSLAAFGAEYLRHLEFDDPESEASEVRLYINEIRTGSLLATLMAASPQIIEAGSYALSVVSFAEKLKKAYSFLTGNGAKPQTIDNRTLHNLSSIVEPVAKDAASQLNIGTNYGPIIFTIPSKDANAIQNNIHRMLADEKSSTTRYHEKVLLYWYQARNEARSTTADRGIIESISDRPVKVVCVTDQLKQRMVLASQNPFREAYIVDVAVETIKGAPAMYRVMELHETIHRPD